VVDWRPGDFPEVDLEIACGAGTYIRAIARDLGNYLGVGGTLAALTRTHSSGFDLITSLSFEAIDAQLQQKTFQPIAPTTVLTHLEPLFLPEEEARRWCQGQKLPSAKASLSEQPLRIYDETGNFLGIGQIVNVGEASPLENRLIAQVVYI